MEVIGSFGPNPRALRMFLAEKNMTIPTKELDILGGENRRAPYTEKNPGGQLPALVLDDGTVIAETVAIFEYLDETNPAVQAGHRRQLASGMPGHEIAFAGDFVEHLAGVQVARLDLRPVVTDREQRLRGMELHVVEGPESSVGQLAHEPARRQLVQGNVSLGAAGREQPAVRTEVDRVPGI